MDFKYRRPFSVNCNQDWKCGNTEAVCNLSQEQSRQDESFLSLFKLLLARFGDSLAKFVTACGRHWGEIFSVISLSGPWRSNYIKCLFAGYLVVITVHTKANSDFWFKCMKRGIRMSRGQNQISLLVHRNWDRADPGSGIENNVLTLVDWAEGTGRKLAFLDWLPGR